MLLFANLEHYLKLLHTILFYVSSTSLLVHSLHGGHLSRLQSCQATNSAGRSTPARAPSGRTHKSSGYTHSSFHQILTNYLPASPHRFSCPLTFLLALDVRFSNFWKSDGYKLISLCYLDSHLFDY